MSYLDNAATTKPYKEVVDTVCDTLTNYFGNPSSTHTKGREAVKIIDDTKKTLADFIGAKKDEVVFTSGGTESINTAIFGAVKRLSKRGKHIISTSVEHSATNSVLKELESRGFEVTYLNPDKTGHIDICDFEKAVREDTILASIMLVQNEVGTMFDVSSMCKILKEKSSFALFHTDAVCALGKVNIDVKKLGVDMMSVSAHKIYAPKGLGALYIKEKTNLSPYILGGGQQGGMRSGTENVPAIAGFKTALEMHKKTYDKEHIKMLKEYLVKMLNQCFLDDGLIYNAEPDVCEIVNFSIPKVKSEVALRVLESHGVYVAASSACFKNKVSYVLANMGLPLEICDSSLRISFSYSNTKEDIDKLVRGLTKCVEMFK